MHSITLQTIELVFPIVHDRDGTPLGTPMSNKNTRGS